MKKQNGNAVSSKNQRTLSRSELKNITEKSKYDATPN